MFKVIHIHQWVSSVIRCSGIFKFILLIGCCFLEGCIPYTCASYRIHISETEITPDFFDSVDYVILKLGYKKGEVLTGSFPNRPAERVALFESMTFQEYDLAVVLNTRSDNFVSVDFCEKRTTFSDAALKERDRIFHVLQLRFESKQGDTNNEK